MLHHCFNSFITSWKILKNIIFFTKVIVYNSFFLKKNEIHLSSSVLRLTKATSELTPTAKKAQLDWNITLFRNSESPMLSPKKF